MRARFDVRTRRGLLLSAAVMVGAGFWLPERASAEPGSTSVQVAEQTELAAYADSDHVTVLTPSARFELANHEAGWGIGARYFADVVSAASVDIVATASHGFSEVRHGVAIDGRLSSAAVSGKLDAALSVEPDYIAGLAGGQATFTLLDARLLLALGYALGHDRAGRAGTAFAVFSRELLRHGPSLGASLVLDAASVLFVGLDLFLERGNAAKPYRTVPLFEPDVAAHLPAGASASRVDAVRLPEQPLERVPGARDRYALSLRYNRRDAGFSLRVAERLYVDTWRMLASTTDVRGAIDLSRALELGLSLRAHVQGGVSFWRRAYVGTELSVPALRTGDRELGPLFSATLGADLRVAFSPEFTGGGQALKLRVAATRTAFLNSLLIEARLALLVALSLEGAFR